MGAEIVKDTDEGCCENSCNSSNRNGLLSISQVTRPVRASHDTCKHGEKESWLQKASKLLLHLEAIVVNKTYCH